VSSVWSGAASRRLVPTSAELPWWIAIAGYAAMYLPVYWWAANGIWQTDEQAHGARKRESSDVGADDGQAAARDLDLPNRGARLIVHPEEHDPAACRDGLERGPEKRADRVDDEVGSEREELPATRVELRRREGEVRPDLERDRAPRLARLD
jgi:hypothetical protein